MVESDTESYYQPPLRTRTPRRASAVPSTPERRASGVAATMSPAAATRAFPQPSGEVDQLRSQLNEANKQKEYLENEIKRLRSSTDVTEDALRRAEEEKKGLQKKYESLLKDRVTDTPSSKSHGGAANRLSNSKYEEDLKSLNDALSRERENAVKAEKEVSRLRNELSDLQSRFSLVCTELDRVAKGNVNAWESVDSEHREEVRSAVLIEKDRIIKQLQQRVKEMEEGRSRHSSESTGMLGQVSAERDQLRHELQQKENQISLLQLQQEEIEKIHALELEEMQNQFDMKLQKNLVTLKI